MVERNFAQPDSTGARSTSGNMNYSEYSIPSTGCKVSHNTGFFSKSSVKEKAENNYEEISVPKEQLIDDVSKVPNLLQTDDHLRRSELSLQYLEFQMKPGNNTENSTELVTVASSTPDSVVGARLKYESPPLIRLRQSHLLTAIAEDSDAAYENKIIPNMDKPFMSVTPEPTAVQGKTFSESTEQRYFEPRMNLIEYPPNGREKKCFYIHGSSSLRSECPRVIKLEELDRGSLMKPAVGDCNSNYENSNRLSMDKSSMFDPLSCSESNQTQESTEKLHIESHPMSSTSYNSPRTEEIVSKMYVNQSGTFNNTGSGSHERDSSLTRTEQLQIESPMLPVGDPSNIDNTDIDKPSTRDISRPNVYEGKSALIPSKTESPVNVSKFPISNSKARFRKLRCPNCEYTTSKKSIMEIHKRVMHTRERPLKFISRPNTFTVECNLKTDTEVNDYQRKSLLVPTGKLPIESPVVGTTNATEKKFANRVISQSSLPNDQGLSVCQGNLFPISTEQLHTNAVSCELNPSNGTEESFVSKGESSMSTVAGPSGCQSNSAFVRTDSESHLYVKPFPDRNFRSKHKCESCDYITDRKYRMKEHKHKYHSGKNSFKCSRCPMSFEMKQNLKSHQRVCKPYTCNICRKSFIKKSVLEVHTRIHSGEKPYSCNYCPKSFFLITNLMTHTRGHTGDRRYKCDLCPKSFFTKDNLNVHRRTHTGEKPYKCDFCPMSTFTKCELNVHRRTHTGEKPYKCDFCPRSFSTKHGLTVHRRTHTGEKPYKCDFCQMSTSTKCDLNAHRRTHTGEKPYMCNFCRRTFSQRGNLKRHTMREHTYGKPYLCDFCSKSFYDKYSLTFHSYKHNVERPYKCENCGRHFLWVYGFAKHNC